METITIYAFNAQGVNSPIEISLEDNRRIPRRGGPGRVTITDQKTGERVLIRRASCGLPRCMCALAEIKREGGSK